MLFIYQELYTLLLLLYGLLFSHVQNLKRKWLFITESRILVQKNDWKSYHLFYKLGKWANISPQLNIEFFKFKTNSVYVYDPRLAKVIRWQIIYIFIYKNLRKAAPYNTPLPRCCLVFCPQAGWLCLVYSIRLCSK